MANFILTHWLSIEGESNIDKKFGHTSYLGMKLSWDFNSHKSKSFQTSINKKMTQLPVRDVDAVTAIRENTPITIFEETVQGRVAAIFSKSVLTDGSVIQSNVPIDIEDTGNINKATGLISGIAIISKDGKIIHYVGSDNPTKQATQKELDDNNIIDINVDVIDKKTNDGFRKAIAKNKIFKGKMTHKDTVISKLVTPAEVIQDNNLTVPEAVAAGLKAGLNIDQLVNDNSLPDDIVKQSATSGAIPLKQAVDGNILTRAEAAKIAINSNDDDKMIEAIEGGFINEIIQAINDKLNSGTPNTYVFIENEHMKKLVYRYLNRLGLPTDNVTSIKAFDKSIVGIRFDVKVDPSRQSGSENIRHGYWEAIADSIMQDTLTIPETIKVVSTINHGNSHWTSSVAEFVIDKVIYKEIYLYYRSHLSLVGNPSDPVIKRNRILNVIGDKFSININNNNKIYGISGGVIKHYDSLYPNNERGPYYMPYSQGCTSFLSNNNTISIESKACIRQGEHTCGDYAIYNSIHDGILGLDVKDNFKQINSNALRSFTEITDKEVSLSKISKEYADMLSMGLISEHKITVANSSELLAKIIDAKIAISKKKAENKHII